MPETIITLQDWSTLLRDVLPFVVILVLIWRGWSARRVDEGSDVWTIRRSKKKE